MKQLEIEFPVPSLDCREVYCPIKDCKCLESPLCDHCWFKAHPEDIPDDSTNIT